MPDCADCGRGELRHGIRTRDGEGSIAALPDGGVVTLERRAAVFYDRAMHELRRVALAPHEAALVATAGDDTYILTRSGRALDLVAIDRRGVRWREAIGVDPGDPVGDNGLDAGPEGPFVYGAFAPNAQGSPNAHGSVPPDAHLRGQQVVAFAREGSVRWRQLFDGAAPTLVADRIGGAYVITDEHTAVGNAVAIRHLDREGHARWTQRIAGTALSGHRLVEAAALARHQGIAFAGVFVGAQLVVGESSLRARRGAPWTSYLAVLDEQTGAQGLAQIIGDEGGGVRIPLHLTAMPSGELAVAGRMSPVVGATAARANTGASIERVESSKESPIASSAESSIDTIVAVIGPAGMTAATAIGGTGDQVARSVVASDDGSVWLSLTSFEEELYPDGATLVVGSRRFAEQGLYVLNLVP